MLAFTGGRGTKRRQQELCTEVDEEIEHKEEGPRSKGGLARVGKANDHDTMLFPEKRFREVNSDGKAILLRRGTERMSAASDVVTKSIWFFPFEMSVVDEDVQNVVVASASRFAVPVDVDDYFQEEPINVVLPRTLKKSNALTESQTRANKKRKKVERYLQVQGRESEGKKPFYILVNGWAIHMEMGCPHGKQR